MAIGANVELLFTPLHIGIKKNGVILVLAN